MKYIKLGFFLVISSTLLAPYQITSNSEQIWHKGREAASKGEFVKALEIWETAKLPNENDDMPDPRIGIDYIELATRHKMKDYYMKASEMFYWGFSNSCNQEHEEELRLELERIKPIIDHDTYKQWRGYAKNDLQKLCSEFEKFWKYLDPTLSTEYNERLIEHWERIAYAQDHFQINRSSVYEADDRAIIYVKFGEPDYRRSNTMRFNKTQVRSWIYDAIDFQFRGGSGGSSGSDSSSSGGSSLSGGAPDISSNLERNRANSDLADRYSKEAEFLHRYREYEIWVYDNENGDKYENPVYIFGQHGDTGFFGMLNSLEEMIPDAAFRSLGSNGSILMPGFILQLLFYQQVITIDDYFAEAFSDLESRLISPNGLNRSTAFAARSRNINRLNYVQIQAPREKSTYLEEIPEIDIETYQYRHLDEDNNTYLATFVKAQPQKALIFDQIQTENFDEKNYTFIFYTKSTDAEYGILNSQQQHSAIKLEGRGNVENMEPSYAYFQIPQRSGPMSQVFTAELQNKTIDSFRIGDKGFPETVRALGKVTKEQPEPLSKDVINLEMSDLVIGINKEPGNKNESGLTDFKVIHDRVLPRSSNLMIHFEVYHLDSKGPSLNKFRVEYQVKPEGRNIFQRIFGGGDKVGLTLNFETSDAYYKTDLEVVTSSFDPGTYELTLKIIEASTSRETSRSITFEIKEES